MYVNYFSKIFIYSYYRVNEVQRFMFSRRKNEGGNDLAVSSFDLFS